MLTKYTPPHQNTTPPIYKGLGDSGSWYTGHYIPKYWLEGYGYMENVILEDTGYHRDAHYVDPKTLQISFNGGKDWFHISKINNMIAQATA